MTQDLMSRLLLANKLATEKQIEQYQVLVTPAKSIGAVLVDQGLLSRDAYQKLLAHMRKIRSSSEKKGTPADQVASPKASATGVEASKQAAAHTTSGEGGGETAPAPAIHETKAPKSSPQKARPQPVAAAMSRPALPTQAATEDTSPGLPTNFIGHSGMGRLTTPIPSEISTQSSLDEILLFARQQGASDVLINPGQSAVLTRFGRLVPATKEAFQSDVTRRLVEAIVDPDRLAVFRACGDLSFVHAIEGGGRFRLTLMKTRDGWCISARVIPLKIRRLEESGLPESCEALANLREGLVLVTGEIGCGKTSTMATLVNLINHMRAAHIVTIEDLVEVVYENARCQVTQREIGLHSCSARAALKAALRQDPDVLVISELPDLEAIKVALTASETGHLVFSTMNTTSASRTIYRLIDSFPPEEQGIIRNRLAQALRAVVSQHLIPKHDGSGLIPAFEVLMINQAVANLIRKGNTHLIGSAMTTGKAGGMVLLDDSLQKLLAQGLISGSEAYHRAINKKLFQKYGPAVDQAASSQARDA